MTQRAKRYNKGKNRLGLVPSFAMKELGMVYTKGAHKYSVYKDADGNEVQGKDIPIENVHLYELIEDAGDNWRKGQKWMDALSSVKRHILAFEEGEDLDPELLTLHVSNAAWGLFQIAEYYKIYPQGDDRPHKYLNMPKIGLDIHEVLADWLGAWMEKTGMKERPTSWNFTKDIQEQIEAIKEDKEFWMSLRPKIDSRDIPFEPHCYITAGPIPSSWTEEWLDKNGFPSAPVYTTGHGQSKADVAKAAGIDIFVDDNFNTFVELNKAGICCYLFDAPHNQRYFVGHKRLFSLKDLFS